MALIVTGGISLFVVLDISVILDGGNGNDDDDDDNDDRDIKELVASVSSLSLTLRYL